MRNKWVWMAIVLVAVLGAAYYSVTRVRKADTSEQEASIAAYEQAKAELPDPLTLEEAKREYEDFVAQHADWQERVSNHTDELRKAFEEDPSETDTAEELISHLWALGDLQGAKAAAEQWTAAVPDEPTAWHRLAQCAWDLGLEADADKAIAKLEALQGRESAFAHARRSRRAHGNFNFITAFDEADKAIKLAVTDDEKAATYHALATAHMALNSEVIIDDEEEFWKNAREGYRAAKESLAHRESAAAHLLAYSTANRYLASLRGHPDWRKQDGDLAPGPGEPREYLKATQKGWPCHVNTWAVVADDRQYRGDTCGAWSAAKIASFLAPRSPTSLTALAVAAERAEIEPDATEAAALLDRVLSGAAPGDWAEVTPFDLRNMAGCACEHRPHSPVWAVKVACMLYPYVRDRIPSYSRAMIDMSIALRQEGRAKEAHEAAQISLQHAGMVEACPIYMFSFAILAAVSAGELDGADNLLKQWEDNFGGPDSCARQDLGWQIALYGGDYDWALQQVEQAIQENPTAIGYIDTKAYVLYKKGDYEESRKLCKALIEAGVGGFAIGYLGLMHAAEGDREKALECLSQAEVPAEAVGACLPPEFEEVRAKLEAEADET
jgi:tetratricopeptide (TPR) repeat protein